MPNTPYATPLQTITRGLLGTFMVGAGVGHLTFARYPFQAQVPDWMPLAKDTTVLASGVVEIGLGLALLLVPRRHRAALGVGLAAFYAAIFPGNIHQYTHHLSALGLDTEQKRFGRLFFQPVLMAAALYGAGALNKRLKSRQ